jgi:hypothetical protein
MGEAHWLSAVRGQELVLADAMEREVAFGADAADEDVINALQADQAQTQVRLSPLHRRLRVSPSLFLSLPPPPSF